MHFTLIIMQNSKSKYLYVCPCKIFKAVCARVVETLDYLSLLFIYLKVSNNFMNNKLNTHTHTPSLIYTNSLSNTHTHTHTQRKRLNFWRKLEKAVVILLYYSRKVAAALCPLTELTCSLIS